MELHSYAKRRISKKWTIEQKRKLVEARIAHDAWFTNKPSSVVPWKNILIAANLDDFNVFFVRKQWSNMLTRYKQYKQTRLGNIASKTIDAELIKRINQEWEFFGPIHAFMTRKTTNLHSYALTHRTENNNSEHFEHAGGQEEEEELVQTSSTIGEQELQNQNTTTTIKTPTKLLHNETIIIQKDCAKENIPNNTTVVIQSNTSNNNNNNNISIDDGIHLFSSDTNDEFQIITETTRIINGSFGQVEEDENMNCVRNTDHDFYSKRSSLGDMVGEVKRHEEDELQEQQSNYFADASEESQGSLNMVVDMMQTNIPTNSLAPLNMLTVRDGNGQTFEIKAENITQTESLVLKEEIHDQEYLHHDMPSTSTHNMEQQPTSSSGSNLNSKPRLSERDKYYRHKRRFNRRLEKRFDAILQVMGQIVKVEYPSVDVTPLVGTVTAVTSSLGKMLSSESEDDDDGNDDDDNQSDDSNLNIPKTTHENQ